MDWIRKEIDSMMKRTVSLMLAAASCLYAQDGVNAVHHETAGPVGRIALAGITGSPGEPVPGAPYSATATTKSIQTLADGNQVYQTSTGTVTRDSQGRTRQDAPLPAGGDPSAEAPHLVFIQDPVTHTSYILNLTDKTAQKTPMPANTAGPSGATVAHGEIIMPFEGAGTSNGLLADTPTFVQRSSPGSGQAAAENLGSEMIEGLRVNGVRTTQTIPAGQMGNAKPFTIVNEVWTSPDLKTVIYSKRSDPLVGEMVYQLTDIVRAEPDSSLFTIPADFQIVDGPKAIVFGSNRE
jgi:hypothetical protein